MDSVIIIPVHNQIDLFRSCLCSVIGKTRDPKVIVIDDGSNEHESRIMKRISEYNGFIYHKNNEAQGFSKACNLGIDIAFKYFDFNVLCLLNSDTQISTPDWFVRAETAMMLDDKISCAGVLSNNAGHHTMPFDYKPKHKVVNCSLLHGFCIFIKRSVILRIGRLDDLTFPHYGSEDDFCLRAVSKGLKNVILDFVYVYHENCKSYGDDVRAKMIKKTIPTLQKRWGINYVENLVRDANNIKDILSGNEPIKRTINAFSRR
jgi:GT2 family glycosyltransferase